MLASELIQHLQDQITNHGDLPVQLYDTEYQKYRDVFEVETIQNLDRVKVILLDHIY